MAQPVTRVGARADGLPAAQPAAAAITRKRGREVDSASLLGSPHPAHDANFTRKCRHKCGVEFVRSTPVAVSKAESNHALNECSSRVGLMKRSQRIQNLAPAAAGGSIPAATQSAAAAAEAGPARTDLHADVDHSFMDGFGFDDDDAKSLIDEIEMRAVADEEVDEAVEEEKNPEAEEERQYQSVRVCNLGCM